MKDIIIFDLDGTLALIDHRRHLVEKKLAFTNWYNSTGRTEPFPFDNVPNENRASIMRIFEIETNWKPDWDNFYELCDKDEPNTPVIEVYNSLYTQTSSFPDWDIYIFSGRSEVVRQKTIDWLNENDVYVRDENLFMRPNKDYTPDEELKKKWLEQIGGPSRVFCVFDDRDKVVAMWRSMGITCFQVAPGNF